MEEDLIQQLIKLHAKISTAESCTGGMLMSTLINVSGASEVINEGFITYANEAKMKYLDVKSDTLNQYGAVSEQTAREMAIGLNRQTGAQVCVSTTGIAGPLGGTLEKPVGTVYIGCYCFGKVNVKHLQLEGERYFIREQTVKEAIGFILNELNLSQV